MLDLTHFPDHWSHLDQQALPNSGRITLAWSRWIADPDAALAWLTVDPDRQVGVRIDTDADIHTLTAWFDQLALLIVDTERPGDGRIFTLGRLLRRHGFSGELRARGDLLPDQVVFLHRCGFDSVELLNGLSNRAPARFYSGYYQPATAHDRHSHAIRDTRLRFDAGLKDLLA